QRIAGARDVDHAGDEGIAAVEDDVDVVLEEGGRRRRRRAEVDAQHDFATGDWLALGGVHGGLPLNSDVIQGDLRGGRRRNWRWPRGDGAKLAEGRGSSIGMRVAARAVVRLALTLVSLLLAPALLPALARADEPPILSLEVRLSGGLTLAEQSSSVTKPSPFGIGVGAEYAAIAYPWTSIYGQVTLETISDVGMGVSAGLRFRPQSGWMRFGLGGKALVIPAMKAGIQAAFGGCIKPGNTHFCLDVE